MTATARPCKATTQRGQPCQAAACTGSDYCYTHDPAQAAQRAESRSRGGHARHGRAIRHILENQPGNVSLQSIADVLTVLEAELNTVLQLEPGVNRARTVTAMLETALKVLVQTELAERIAALEQRLNEENAA